MPSPMLPRERCDYSAIVDRPPLQAAGRRAARVLDHRQLRGLGHRASRWRGRCCRRRPDSALLPDVPNWSWHEYGMRVGAWRFFELFARLGIRPTLAINARVCEDYPRVAEQAKRDGWEFMGHSYEQGPIHKEPDQAAMIERSLVDHRALHRHAPGRLARAGPDADAGDAGAARRGRHQIYRRLGLRRRADHDPHRQRAAGHAALLGRAQRHPDDDRAAPRERISAQARHRPVRPALRRRRASAPRSWRSRSTPTSAASRTGSNTSKRSTTTSAASTACCTGTARRSWTGTWRRRGQSRGGLRARACRNTALASAVASLPSTPSICA